MSSWLDKRDPIIEKKRSYLMALILKEIELMTLEQLALAITIARKARAGDTRVLAALSPDDERQL